MRARTAETLWNTTLGQLELQVTRPNFETWLRHTAGLRLEGDRLIVGVPSDFALEWLRTRMRGQIDQAVSRVAGSDITVSFEVLGAQPAGVALTETPPGPSAGSAAVGRLDPRLTFETFVVTKANRVAQRVAQRIVASPAEFHPLVLCGATGTGKTHLLHAIGNAAAAAGRSVAAMTGELFVDRYARSVRNAEPHTFRRDLEACDLLLLDDFPFLISRPASLEQFFLLLDTLAQHRCPTVISTDTHPNELTSLPARLRSRLQGGLVTELRRPAREDRVAILRSRAAHLTPPLPDAILTYLADHPYETISELQGALQQVLAFSQFSHAPLTIDAAREALFPLRRRPQTPPDASRILRAVCEYFQLSREQLAGASRAHAVTYPRHVAMYLLRQLASLPLAQIGALLGDRDHATVLNGCRRIQRELDSSSFPETRAHIADLNRLLTQASSVA